LLSLTRDGLGLLVDHLPGDEVVLEGRVSVSEAASLLFLLLWAWRNLSGRFYEQLQSFSHGSLQNQCKEIIGS
jgi:hypothetical protein